MKSPYSLDNLRKPDLALLPEDMKAILSHLNEPKKYFELIQEMEKEGLAGHRFDDAFGRLRDTGKIQVSDLHRVTAVEATPPMPFSEAGQSFLDAFYRGHKAEDLASKIQALRKHLVKSDMLVTGCFDETSELRAIEYYVLLECGFNE